MRSAGRPDIVVFGFQEVVDLESRRMVARHLALGQKKSKADGAGAAAFNERVTGAYKRWHDKLTMVMRLASPPDDGYTMVGTENMVGMFSIVFVKTREVPALTDPQIKVIKRGMHGRYGNKVLSPASQRKG